MKRIWFTLLLVPLLATGCARHYVMTLNSGAKITTRGKPHVQGGSYVYKDLRGEPAAVAAGSVAEIAPASMVRKQKSPFMRPSR